MYKKMLVPLDASEYAECTLGHVKEIAAAHGISEVVLLTVVEPPRSAAISYLGADRMEGLNKQAHESALEYLQKTKARLGLSCDVKTVVMGAMAAEGILDYAEKNAVDLIVMSTHGRSGPSKWFVGSVAERVLERSPVPVFLIPAVTCRLTS
jgi:nucleotide-binding universal stress UspA family protein